MVVIGQISVDGCILFKMSVCTIKTGRVFPVSVPIPGSRLASQTSYFLAVIILKIFKFTIPKNADAEVVTASYKVSPPVEERKPYTKPAPVVEDEDDDEEEFVPAPKPPRPAKKAVVLEEDDEEDDDDGDDDDAPSLGWMGKK